MISFPFDGRVTEIKQLSAPSGGNVQVPVSDRNYTSKQLREIYKQMFTDGIVKDIPNCFKVSPGTGMKLLIQPGAGMMGGAMGIEKAIRTIQVQASHPTLDRIDTVVLRADDNTTYRNADLYIIQGIASELPVAKPPIRNDAVYEIVLAHVFIARGTTSIPTYRITDTRLNSELCGLMQPRPGADTTGIFNQYQDALDRFLDTVASALDKTLAGKLQLQIGNLEELKTSNKENLTGSINEVFTNLDTFKKIFESIKEWTPLLVTPTGREVSQDKSGGYATGKYAVIGKICFLTLSVKTKITEWNEYARVSLPAELGGFSEGQTLSIGECANLTSEYVYSAQTVDNQIRLQSQNGSQNVQWQPNDSGKQGYLKISGFIILN